MGMARNMAEAWEQACDGHVQSQRGIAEVTGGFGPLTKVVRRGLLPWNWRSAIGRVSSPLATPPIHRHGDALHDLGASAGAPQYRCEAMMATTVIILGRARSTPSNRYHFSHG